MASLFVHFIVMRSAEAVTILTFNPELVDPGHDSNYGNSKAHQSFPRILQEIWEVTLCWP
jgi:hypothetical protein